MTAPALTTPFPVVVHPTGTFVRIAVRPCSRTRALRIAKHRAHEQGYRVVDIASVVDQGADLGWIVEFSVVPRGGAS